MYAKGKNRQNKSSKTQWKKNQRKTESKYKFSPSKIRHSKKKYTYIHLLKHSRSHLTPAQYDQQAVKYVIRVKYCEQLQKSI